MQAPLRRIYCINCTLSSTPTHYSQKNYDHENSLCAGTIPSQSVPHVKRWLSEHWRQAVSQYSKGFGKFLSNEFATSLTFLFLRRRNGQKIGKHCTKIQIKEFRKKSCRHALRTPDYSTKYINRVFRLHIYFFNDMTVFFVAQGKFVPSTISQSSARFEVSPRVRYGKYITIFLVV